MTHPTILPSGEASTRHDVEPALKLTAQASDTALVHVRQAEDAAPHLDTVHRLLDHLLSLPRDPEALQQLRADYTRAAEANDTAGMEEIRETLRLGIRCMRYDHATAGLDLTITDDEPPALHQS